MDKIKPAKVPARERLYSIDALRGFDMFWIVGGAVLVRGLANDTGAGWLNSLAMQFRHVPWDGFRFYDLIFPLFMFIAGAVIPFSLLTKLEKGVPATQIMMKTFRRVAILIALGIVYNGVLRNGFSDARYVSILGQIGIAYFFTVLIVIFSDSQRKWLLWLGGIIGGVAFIQLFVPVPGIGAGVLTPEGHINGYIDRMLLPGRLAYGPGGMQPGHGIYDALGILSTVSSIGITLMGVFAGVLIRKNTIPGLRKALMLAGTGSLLIIAALIISPFYPVIKNAWTSTFTLLTGGISFMLVALFYLVIDVWGWRKWTLFFRVIGMNPIFIYLLYRLVNVGHTSEWLFGWLIHGFGDDPLQTVWALASILLIWGLLHFMYKNKIFIKI